MSLILKDGKFYRDGVFEPLEFGNKDQIKIIRDSLRLANQLLTTGVPVDVEFESVITAKVEFRCQCGQLVWFEREVDYDEDYKNLYGVTSSCLKCKTKYILHNHEGLTVKLKK